MSTDTTERALLRDTARRFARQHLPVGRTPEDFRRAHAAAGALGLTSILLPPDPPLDTGGTCLDLVLVLEELGAADVAFAANAVNLPAGLAALLARTGNPAQRALVGTGPPPLLAGALNEADVAGSDLFCPSPGPAVGIRTSAVRQDGGGYLLNGAKCGFVTNAGVADSYLVLARTDPAAAPAQGLSMFLVPAGTPGLSCGPRTELIGWPGAHHAEVLLDDVRVGPDALVGAEHRAAGLLAGLPEMPIGLAACFVGLARTAYEQAVTYARRRISWGRPLIEHGPVALKLADMYVDLRTARLVVHDAARTVDDDPADAMAYGAAAAKTVAVDAAIANAQRAMEIFGGAGVAADSPVSGLLGDAWVGYACDFTRDVLRLGIAAALPALPQAAVR
ncbi:acyl-CoA dehydrogenase family protein [Dactylosporangium siamense]|uniref:Acyl-CoA dehydrogenase n=1 Tax=Dactylosporangium siamense TaxID=685454 RepID=A0A919PIJ6_9ACTN|nr:acyl-CoA dehydrogenase [Dactylosporangium siamense]GIG42588.1 acyl-CoA dehydrogenase [Dactylosporangium siamense]